MAATATWKEDNGAATGSPAKGATRSNASNVNWKAMDNTSTAYTAAPIQAGTNSMPKYNSVQFTGTFTSVSNAKWAHTAGTLGTGLSLYGGVTSTYATPSTAAVSGLTDISSVTAIGSGTSVNFSTVGPEGASPTSTLTASGYTQFLVTQLRTTLSATQGDTAQLTFTLQWDEN